MSDPQPPMPPCRALPTATAYAALLGSVGDAGGELGDSGTYFLKPGYRSRSRVEYFVDDVDDAVYQPDVYAITALAARRVGASCIIDVGCGRAAKLMELAGEFETVGIDVGANLEHCRRQHPTRTWLACDLDRPHTLPVPPEVLARSVIVCSDVVEHLLQPEHLLRSLSAALRHARLAVISTPERDVTRGFADMGPPANPCHIREWNLAEFTRLLEHHALPPLRTALTRSDDRWAAAQTMLIVVAGARVA
jgi:SAM-dependent methyltransferase